MSDNLTETVSTQLIQEVEVPTKMEVVPQVPTKMVESKRKPIFTGTYYDVFQGESEKKTVLVRKEGDVVAPKYIKRGDEFLWEDYTNITLTDERIRREYISMKLYQEVGLPVPNVELQSLEGKTALLVDDLGLPGDVRNVNLSNEKLSESQRSDLLKYHLISYWLDDANFVCNFVKKSENLVLTNAILSTSDVKPSGVLQFSAEWIQQQKFQNNFHIPLEIPYDKQGRKEYIQAMSSLRAIDPERVVEIVKSSGLPIEQVRKSVKDILRRRDLILALSSGDTETLISNSGDWENLDGILEKKNGYNGYKTIPIEANKIVFTLRENGEVLGVLKSKLSKEQLQDHGSDKLENSTDLIKILNGSISKNDLLEEDKTQDLLKVKQQVEIARSKYPGFVFKLLGYEKVESELVYKTDMFSNHLESWIYGKEKGLVSAIDHPRRFDEKSAVSGRFGIPTAGSKVENLLRLEAIIAPTQKQIDSIRELIVFLNSDIVKNLGLYDNDLFTKQFGDQLSSLNRKRIDFKEICNSRSTSLVTHLGVPESIEESIRGGYIESSLKQSQKGKEVVHIGSPGGERRFLPDVSFAVLGADLGYGGEVTQTDIKDGKFITTGQSGGKVNYEYSVGWVAPYEVVVNGKAFAETVNTGNDMHQELHVFDRNYSENKQIGAEVSVDSLHLVVPEKDLEKWRSTLLTNGKSSEWVNGHLKSYPEWLDISTYVRYFLKPQDLGFEPKPGIFVTDLKQQARVLLRDQKPQYLFTWETV